jgi:thiopeptide-type bacteriocin biosynthesis protein
VADQLHPFQADGITWKIQTDTYKRELKRYGSNTIHLAEQLFYHDSISKIHFLENTEGDEREDIRWLWGIRHTDELLNVFSFTLEEKIDLFAFMKESFGREFSIDKNSKNAINKIFNEARGNLKKIFMPLHDVSENEFSPLLGIIGSFCESIKPLGREMLDIKQNGQLQVNWLELFSSYIHMSLNRLFPASQRKNEMIMYEMMHRHYTSLKAIDKKQPEKKV